MIEFFADEDVVRPALRERLVKTWIKEVAASYKRKIGELYYQFCSDEHILRVNQEFLQHDYYTDIITFDNSEGQRIAGDLLISLDTVRSNAEEAGAPFDEELHRVIIHGVLHLCGLNDKAPGEPEQMRAAEDKALELLRSHLKPGEPFLL